MNKIELPGIMICEWDADTKCIIISAEEGYRIEMKTPPGNGVEFTDHGIKFHKPISEAHASLVTMEKMDGPYSDIEGKWLKWRGASDPFMTNGKWYKIYHVQNESAFFYNDLHDQDAVNLSEGKFKTSDPSDYNPDERKPHQLQEYDAVECTPEERAEIIRIADECGVPMHKAGMDDPEMYPFLGFSPLRQIAGVFSEIDSDYKSDYTWHTVPDFISKIRGTHTEEKKIPFDLERWKAGDFVRVETVEGNQVDQLVALQLKDSHAMAGVVCGCFASWTEAGIFVSVMETDKDDLTLIVKESTEHKHPQIA